MNSEPLNPWTFTVSITIPTYNASIYISKQLKRLKGQSAVIPAAFGIFIAYRQSAGDIVVFLT
jgi:hypothetical protein